ncbi:hypothetical protein JST97_07690 [bacterium]|nr:hypothetical protein [bacterium]
MINKTTSLQNLSPLRPQTQPARETQVKDPSDGWAGGVGPAKEQKPALPQSETQGAESQKSSGHHTALKVALGTLGVAGALVGMAQQAQAQVRPAQSVAPRSLADQVRDTRPVFAGSVNEVVNQFNAGRQIYVVGNPQYNGQNLDLKQFQDVFAKHPNAYIVLIGESDNVKSDDYNLSRGIANSAQFQSVVDKETGQKNGAVFMVYFKVTDQKFIQQTGKTRAIYMRSEQLLDDAGVGENNFVDRETLEPRSLMQTYVSAVQSGQSVPQAFSQVLDKIDAGANSFVASTVRGATQAVDQAGERYKSVEKEVKDFRKAHGEKGSLAQPDMDAWKNRLENARKQLKSGDYAAATENAKALQTQISAYESQLSQFAQAPAQAQEISRQISSLQLEVDKLPQNGQAEQARTSLGQAKAALSAYQQKYDSNELNFQADLDTARTAAQSTSQHISASRSDEATARNLKLYGSSALGVGLIATALILNYRARGRRKESEKEMDEALAALGERSKELIRVMNEADVSQIASYTGTTQKLAKDLLTHTADALALMGGGEKVLAEARQLIKGDSFGSRLKNMFSKGNFDKAIELLTDKDQQVPYELNDSKQVNLEKGSKADAWRDYLLSTVTGKAGQESFVNMLDKLSSLAASNEKTTQVLLKESREVGAYLDGVKDKNHAMGADSEALQKSGQEDHFFTAPTLTSRVVPYVDQLIEKGHAIKGTDPFRARQEFGEVSERMIADGHAIIEVGTFGRNHTLPVLAQADEALHPHQIVTDWAHLRKEELSIALDREGEKSLQQEVNDQVKQIKSDLEALEHRIQTVVQLDDKRWNLAQPQISDADQAIKTAREGLCKALQAAGVFKDGTPDRVLREPDRDPSAPLYQAQQNYDAIKPLLDQGNVEEPSTHLKNVASLTRQAGDLVKDTRAAFEAYPADSGERVNRHQSISNSIPNKYQPSLERIQKTYTESAQKSVVGEVSSSGSSRVGTVSEFLDKTFQLLDKAKSITEHAAFNYDRAHLLEARDELAQVNNILVQGQVNLDAITGGEATLARRQAEAEQGLKDLTARIAGTDKNSEAVYVRAKAKDLLKQVQARLEESKPVVFQKPASPYEALNFLASVESLRTQVENTISFDHAAYDAANSAIAQAKSLIQTADAEVDKAARTGWSQNISGYGPVQNSVNSNDLNPARRSIEEARSQTSGAEGQLGPQKYEDAKAVAESAQNSAQKARQQAAAVVSAAQAVFNQMVSGGEAIAEASREVDNAQRQIDDCSRQSWSQYVNGFGQVQHSVDSSDMSRARSILDDARSNISSARSQMNSNNFDSAKSTANRAEQRASEAVSEARRAVEAEHQVFLTMVRDAQECAEAKSMIDRAEGDIRSAESAINNASRQSWSQSVSGYGTVSHSVSYSDLSSANSYLSNARNDLSQARSYLSSHSYSSSQSEARSASSNADRAESEARSAVSRAHDEFERKVRQAEASVQPPPSSGGGGGGGGSTGGGGGIGGGGSGSTGGGW